MLWAVLVHGGTGAGWTTEGWWMAMTTTKRAGRVKRGAEGPCCGPLRPATAEDGGSRARTSQSVSAETGALVGLRVIELPVEKIHRRPSNRGGVAVTAADVAELMESIEAFDLSRPIEVRETSEEQELPVGHYELTKGERRWTAYRALGRATIPALVRVGLDAAAAAVQVAIDNTHSRELDPVQRAQSMRDAMATGLSLADAAKAHGLGESAAKNALRLLDLPAKVRAAVSDGRLAERTARYLVPYTQVPGVMAAVEKGLGGNSLWWMQPGISEEQVKSRVRRLVADLTRPVDGKTKHDYGWQMGKHPCYFRKSMDDELRRELAVVEIRVDNKPIEVATNVKRFDELNQVEIDKRKKAKAAKEQAETNGKSGSLDAEVADYRRRQQDDRLLHRVSDWRQRLLRQAIAKAMQPACRYSEKIACWALLHAREANGYSLSFTPWLQAIRGQLGIVDATEDAAWWDDWRKTQWEKIDALTAEEGEDPVWATERLRCELARALIWPVATGPIAEDVRDDGLLAPPGELPNKMPLLEAPEIEQVAEYLSRAQGLGKQRLFGLAWEQARQAGPERQLFLEVLGYPNRRQLQAWCEEWGCWQSVQHWKTVGSLVEAVAELHHGQNKLPPLKCMAAEKFS